MIIDVEAVKNNQEAMAKIFDHTILKPDATKGEVKMICQEASKYKFASVCVNACHAADVRKMLENSGVLTCVVVGFPLGAMSSQAKVAETSIAVEDGAQEIDMVINVGALKDKLNDYVYQDISAVVKAAKNNPVKVIIETCLLNDEEKAIACQIAKKAGASFVKTSTGFSKDGAKEGDIRLMRKIVGPDMGVKASGGIRTYEKAISMLAAGADRIGSSSSVKILAEMKR